MSVNDVQTNFGSWSIKLRSKAGRDENGKPLPAAPQELLDLFAVTDGPDAFLGHIIVTSQAFDPLEVDVLALSRYTGVLRESKFSSDDVEIAGSGLVYWLGDLQERGPIFDDELSLEGESFVDGITAILPDAIVPGNIIPEVGTASANYLFVTARAALEDWLSLFGAEYYITPQGELNAGTPASLFPSYNNPTTFVIRKGSGADMNLKPLPLASATMSGDMTNFATKVISLVQVEETSFLEGMAEDSTAKRDLHGNLVSITDINNETTTLAANAAARAAARLAQIGVPRTSVELSTENYDIHGDFKPGDSIWVYDIPSGLYDLTNEIEFRGQTYWPVKLRVLEITYPVTKGMGVYFRAPTPSATIYDLTPYFVPEPAGTSQIEVGAFTRSMIPPSSGGIGGVIAPVLNPESPPPIPDPPTIFSEERSLLVKQPTTSGGNPLPATVTKFNVYASTTSGFTPGPTNYIGYISVVRADVITLGIPLLKSFKWEEEDLTYVRTTAINGGGEGPASTEVAETAGLIPSAAILNLAAEKIDAGTINVAIELNAAVINGGDINGSVITSGIVQTALSGQRVALSEDWTDQIRFYTGDADETNWGQVGSFVSGAGGTRKLQQYMRTAMFTSQKWAHLEMNSGTQDGATPASVVLSVKDVAALVGYVSITPNIVDLNAVTAGGRVYIDDQVEFISGGATRVHVQADRVNFSVGINMQSQQIWGPSAGSTSRIDCGNDFAVHSQTISRLVSNDGNVQLRVGINTDEADLVDNASIAFRIFTADVVDACDGALKNEVGPAPWVLDDILGTKFGMQERKSKPGSAMLGFAANKVPEYVTEELNLETGKGKSKRKMRGSKPNAAAAWALVGIQNLYKSLDERIAALEKAK